MTGNDPGKPFGPDGLNDELWDRLRQIISSANRGDADAHALAILRWPEEVSLAGQQHAGAYLLYLMYRQVKLTLGRAPSWLHLNRDKFRAEGLLDDLPGEQGP